MRRSNRLAVMVATLLTVGATFATIPPRAPALAADPLSAAKQQQQQLNKTISQQRSELDRLKVASATLSDKLAQAKAELADATAEYERTKSLLAEVTQQVTDIKAQLAELKVKIADLDRQLTAIAAEIAQKTNELRSREALLQDHLRSAYERSQTSLLEILLSARSLDDASTQVGYMLDISAQDTELAGQIRDIRADLETRQDTLAAGRQQLAEAREAAEEQSRLLAQRQAELETLTAQLAEQRAAADAKRRQQEAALNASLAAQGNVEAAIAQSVKAQEATDALVARLQAEAAAQAAARKRALDEARRKAAAEAELAAQRRPSISSRGFSWPEASPRVTQEWGPTSFVLEPSYTYNGTYYPHFHNAIDMASGCGTPIRAAATGVITASGQPLWPWDTGFGVIMDNGNGITTLYWHMQPRVVVRPGQGVSVGQIIGYEGSTGNSTGCHLHFGVNDNGVWQNPRWYLP
jgi:murein DD-endopeptidase MepM/ murein hydrolase activator NlpD